LNDLSAPYRLGGECIAEAGAAKRLQSVPVTESDKRSFKRAQPKVTTRAGVTVTLMREAPPMPPSFKP